MIVGIDEASFAELQRQWPWPRGLHARLIEALDRAGAAVIGFDVVFAEPSQAEEDRRLAQAIARAGKVVLAADLAVQESAQASQLIRVEPLALFKRAGATAGLAAVALDQDLVLRRLPTAPDSFWRAVLDTYLDRRPGPSADPAPRGLIRYAGPDHSFPYVSYYQALEAERLLPKDIFRDRIVLVGRDVRAAPDIRAAQADLFATPFSLLGGTLTPGVEVQATLIANALERTSLAELPRAIRLFLLALVVLGAAWAMREWRPLAATMVLCGIVAALAAASWAAFEHGRLWSPISAPLLATALVFLGQGGTAFLRVHAERRRIKQAFTHYAPRAVVEEMVAHPERLRLGGERRMLTLLFTDLAGFTELSERLEPERIAQLLNAHMTGMTGVVFRHGGTVDKFIGDAIMAFWGAPLADPEHALHACQAAIAMQQVMRARRAQTDPLERELRMRVGIHSGEAVVGNMGSVERFGYTAIGDNVNLAARLEGVNKLYGTDILVSETTAALVEGRLPLRRLDRVRVKGKSRPVEIYTFWDGASHDELNNKAIAAYRAQRWDEAENLWRRLGVEAEDPVALAYLERIEQFRENPPSPDWDGSFTLTAK
jgi:adenylate cyclase